MTPTTPTTMSSDAAFGPCQLPEKLGFLAIPVQLLTSIPAR
jgi:hypothetical protein